MRLAPLPVLLFLGIKSEQLNWMELRALVSTSWGERNTDSIVVSFTALPLTLIFCLSLTAVSSLLIILHIATFIILLCNSCDLESRPSLRLWEILHLIKSLLRKYYLFISGTKLSLNHVMAFQLR